MEPKSPGGDKEGSTSIELGLGIGAAHGGGGGVIKEGKSAFTAAQLHELQQQRLVLNYLVEGLPVPHHLIVPIWKSVAKSFGPANGGIYNQYPTFIGFNHQGFDYKGTTDPEPSRCRRTDGKKWRCSKEVVPHQKYCERHMHRGRNRPRKTTEASVSTPESSLVLSPNCTKTNTESSKSVKTKSKEPVPVTVKLELATPSSNTASRTPVGPANGSHESQNEVSMKDSIPVTEESIDGSCGSQKQKDTASTIVNTTGTGGSDNNLTVKNAAAATATITASSSGGVSKDQSTVVVKKETVPTTSTPHIGGGVLGIRKDGFSGKMSAASPTFTGYMNQIGSNTVKKETVAFMTKKDIRGRGETDVIITSTATSSTAAAEINCNRRVKSDIDETKYAEYDHSNTRVSTWSNNDASSWRFVSLAPPGFGLSPNSVLQVAGGGNPHPNSDADIAETELTRCRRTDGKKWRCSKEVIPDEKYCGRHMHRGAKKLAVGVTSLQSVTVAAAPPPSTSSIYHDPPLAIPKKATNLNTELSISIASSSQQEDEGEDSPSSSDATTITDENGSIAHLLVLSP